MLFYEHEPDCLAWCHGAGEMNSEADSKQKAMHTEQYEQLLIFKEEVERCRTGF